MTDKINLFKDLGKTDYAQPKTTRRVETTPGTYLAIEGRGEPGGESFCSRIGALYAVAYTVKMTRKFADGRDYVVGKLEAIWWTDDERPLEEAAKEDWCWKLLIRIPDFVEQAELDRAVATLLDKGKDPQVKDVKRESLHEGPCVQMLHVGPYENERETIALMMAFANEEGLAPHGRHHEIYLSDPRRVPPDRLKTILRMPVREG